MEDDAICRIVFLAIRHEYAYNTIGEADRVYG